ncbi:hypothetical protein [Flavobacterium luteolum]|uniref:hypothetical protein n=1 Tax=Flavobacterium luteolum TaxID=3003259 RepID=UPI00248F24C9|nr:hypothetical protein [Flavobacterium luteolum]
MTTRNNNKKENPRQKSIHNHFEILSSDKNDFKNIAYLYGMSPEQYKEGLEIHLKCFSQIEKVKRIIN